MKIVFLIVPLICLSHFCNSQSPKNNIDTFYLIALDERLKLAEAKLDQVTKENQKNETTTSENLKINKEDIKSLLNIYLSIALGSAALIGFAVNFFGKSAIKHRAEEIIRETAQRHTADKIVEALNSTLTNELIEEIIKKKSQEELNRILKQIESQGSDVINDFKSKGDEVIKSMLALPPLTSDTLNIHSTNANQSILQAEATQADELFNLAFNSTDARLQVLLYKNVLDLQPKNVSALNNLAAAYNTLNETKNAIEVLNKATKLDDKYYLAFSNRGNSYYLENNWEKAFADLNIAIALKKDFYYPYSIKSRIYKKQNNLHEAEKVLKEAIEENPSSADAQFTLAFFYEEQKQFDKSLLLYEKAKLLNFPNLAMLYNNMAVLFRRQKKFDTALEYLEKAKHINSDFPNLEGTMALIYADKNDTEKFYEYLKIALQKGCRVWDYLDDPGFDKYRDSKRLETLITPFKEKYFA